MDSKALCSIIEACAKNKVLDFVMGDVRISFGGIPVNHAAHPTAVVEPLGTASEVRTLEEEDQADLEDQVKAEHEAYLLASDPLEYEKLMLSRGDDNKD